MQLNKNDFPAHIFRAYDIRGKLNVLTPAVVEAIAEALSQQYLQHRVMTVVLGYDARLTSPSYAEILQQTFKKNGLNVIELGCCSTPCLYFFAMQHGGNGVMVTASHNPKSDNGVKWMCQGDPSSPEQIQQVALLAQQHYQQQQCVTPFVDQPHQFIESYKAEYLQYLQRDIHLARPLKVVVDGLYGSAGQYAVAILQRLGCQVIALRCEANGEFPEHAPDPSTAQHLLKLCQTVREQQADLGFALDGDGDRVVMVDETGAILRADRLLCLFARICLEQQPQREVVFDVKCSSLVIQQIKHYGGIPHMLRTGSTFLRKYIAHSQGQAIFGGEYAGHYVFNDGRGKGYDDGLYAALRAMEYLAQIPAQKFSALFVQIPERYATEDTYIRTYQHHPVEVLQDIEQQSHKIAAHLTKIDGVRLDFDDGFGIIRASNTGEYLTVRFDASSASRLNEIRQNFAYLLSEKYPEIAHDICNAQ